MIEMKEYDWHPMQKVVCLHDFDGLSVGGVQQKDPPKKNGFYTVSQVVEAFVEDEDRVFISLVEIEPDVTGRPHMYEAKHFISLADLEKMQEE